MTRPHEVWLHTVRWIGRAVAMLVFAAGVVVLMLWLAGKFAPKVPVASTTSAAQGAEVKGDVVPVRSRKLPLYESAVGSIRAVHETSVGSKLLARVVEVNLKAGQEVKKDEVLVRLDDSDLRAKLQGAQAAVRAAAAAYDQAAAEEKRNAPLAKDRAISQQEYDRTLAAMKKAEAEWHRAQETVKEIQATLDWATIRAPMNGVVIDKHVDAGDTVTPGQVLVTIFDPTRMQLVASVRESLALQLQTGQDIGVQVQGLNKQCSGTISEIVPEAQSASRAFQVKVTGPCPTGIYSGMFGRILIPLAEEEILVVPQTAVRHVGQLELVDVVEKDRVSRRAVRTGRKLDGDVEILSGLREGEQIVAAPASAAA